jgi:hypothetical protein
MKKVIPFICICAFIAFILCSCTLPSARQRYGVFEGKFIDGECIRVIEGSPHNEGWYCEVQILHTDGSIQRILMEWGEGQFAMYEWRDIIDLSRMELLYSGKYRFTSDTKLKLVLETGDTYTLNKTDGDPLSYTFDAIRPNNLYGRDDINHKYTGEQIDNLLRLIDTETYTFSELRKDFSIEELTDTYQDKYGYCAPLLKDDGSSVFVFVNYDLIVQDVMITDSFLTKAEFEGAIGSKTTKSQVLSFDHNALDLSSTDEIITGHIVQEGVIVVTYSLDGSDPIVDSVLFVDNRETRQHNNSIVRDAIPHITEKLKMNS